MMIKKVLAYAILGCIMLQVLTATSYAESALEVEHQTIPVIVYATQKARLASPLNGFIEYIPVKEGDFFKKGQVLIKFDCSVLKSEQAQANAAHRRSRDVYSGHQRLSKLDALSKIELAKSKAEFEGALAGKQIKDYEVKHCEVVAPFSGQVVELKMRAHEYVERGQQLIEIVGTENLYVKLIVPSIWLKKLKIGTPFGVHLIETQQNYTAKVSRIIYHVDPVSHTVVIYGKIDNVDQKIMPGMSGEARFR